MRKKTTDNKSYRNNIHASEAADIRHKRLIALFLIGCVLFNYPILSLFNVEYFIYDIPLLYGYIFVVWFIFILVIKHITAIQSETHHNPDADSA